ncbi:MAG: cell division protein SepF [Mogibacterium sp.]|nr:cell division protein SepF [Mogibacterium sp.]
MGFGDTVRSMLGIGEEPEEEITPEEIQAEKAALRKSEAAAAAQTSQPANYNIPAPSNFSDVESVVSRDATQSRSYSMNGSGPFKMLVIEPKSFDECTKLVDNLKSRKPVIINLEKVETDLARKMFDFLSGATYALNGNVQRITSNIFIFAPANVDIAAKLNRTEPQESAGYNNTKKNNPWG